MKNHQSGFTLVEVLISIVVLSIGMLGLAGLQTTGLRSNHSASLRSQATLLAYEITDRIRANRAGYLEKHYNQQTPAAHNCTWAGNPPSICTPQQMAQNDIYEWHNTVSEQLPLGVGVVCLDSTPNDGGDTDGNGVVDASELACDNAGTLYTVKLWWVDQLDETPVFKRFATAFQP